MASSVSKSSKSKSSLPRARVPRYLAVAEAIRARIVSGEFPPGSQLPSERELAEQNGVALLTARQAVGVLVKKGIVRRSHGHGTFVESSIQKDLVGLVCGPNLRDESAYFYRAIVKMLEAEGERRNLAFRIYDCFTDESGRPRKESQNRKNFRSDLANYNFFGLIEVAPGRDAMTHPVAKSPLPRAVFEGGHPQSDVDFEVQDFGRAAVRHLAGQGCRKILIVTFVMQESAAGYPTLLEGAFDGVAESGIADLKVRVTYLTVRPGDYSRSVYESMRDLIQGWEADETGPPDGLIVADDIFMRDVAIALIHSGFGFEKKLAIVCRTYEGAAFHYGVPVIRYEYPLDKFAQALLDMLDFKRQGAALPKRPVYVKGTLKKEIL